MQRSVWFAGLLCGAACCFSGCGEPINPEGTAPSAASATTEASAPADAAPADETAAIPEEEYETKRAGVGATGKGEYGVTSEQPMSIITTPVSVYFKAQEKTVFDMQIPQALNLFQASEGRFPESEQEFMEKIIKANMIMLPKLPEGDVYFYDVPSHTLMIRSRKG